ncbi:aldo/keto reductase [Litorihabitans aurantiacus]|uniref:Oxidoreductase n=1 Tax=Litorihabitans aurantiacus TaxID=1930061 RepID=A0AA37XFN4_9MICO|nr:aldo/keto reductase [Litorihabitans aurantiacus]GMA31865.1 putative oxidoreductase [Litorihabitans aurantiacus]
MARTIALSDGTTIPQIGFGVWQVDPDETQEAVSTALEAGYRHVDTAQMYRNEAGVGAAVAASSLDRGDVFLTSKVNNDAHAPQDTKDSVARTLELLQSDYVDLMLIHWPLASDPTGYIATYEALLEEKAAGRIRSVGVSNFHAHHLDAIIERTGVAPVVNQIEVHPYFANPAVAATTERGIAVESWSPLASGKLFGDSTIEAVAAEVGATAGQTVIAWHLATGKIVLPKSVTPSRIVENLAAADIELSADQIARIDALDKGAEGRTGPNPDELG